MEHLKDWVKLALAWIFTWVGHALEAVTLGRLVLAATLILTCLQIYILWRDKVARQKKR